MARADHPADGVMDFVRDALIAKAIQLYDSGTHSESCDLRDRRNIAIATRLEAFRRLVFVKCLQRIRKGLA